jgi:eukaryotic translation initiation factor 2C
MAGGGGKGKGKGTKPGSGNETMTDPVKVTDKENSIIGSTTAIELRGRTPMGQPPCRPGFGTVGRPATVSTNHACIDISPSLRVRQYSIKIKEVESKDPKQSKEPKKLARRTLKEVIRVFLDRCRLEADRRGEPQRAAFVTDFSETLYHPYDCDIFDNDETIPPIKLLRGKTVKTYSVTVDPGKTLPLRDLFNYISNFGPFDSALKSEYMQMLNVWLHHKSKEDQGLVVFGSKTFPMSAKQDWRSTNLGDGLTAMRGIFASIRPATCRILANIQVTHGTFFTPGPLADLIRVYSSDYQALDRVLKLLRVRATHLRAKRDKASSSQSKQPAGDYAVYFTIIGLARRDNTPRPSDDKRARVISKSNMELGAGPEHVEFWLEEKEGEGQPSWSSKPLPRWITVSEYYAESECYHLALFFQYFEANTW